MRVCVLHRAMVCSGVDLVRHFLQDGSESADLIPHGTGAAMAAVPYLRRLGYSMTVRPMDDECPITVGLPGRATKRSAILDRIDRNVRARKAEFHFHLYGRSFRQVRARGVLKCVPRLLGWLRAARISLDDPVKHPDKLTAAIDAMEADMAAPAAGVTLKRSAAELEAVDQEARKRQLFDAQFASEAGVADGARWAGIGRACDDAATPTPMRLECVVGEHAVFQVPDLGASKLHHDVVVLHRDAFTVKWVGTIEAAALESRFEARFLPIWQGGDEGDEDEDDEDDENDEDE